MCANCTLLGVKLDGDKLVSVYSPASADTLDEWDTWRSPDSGDIDEETWAEMNYARTKADQ